VALLGGFEARLASGATVSLPTSKGAGPAGLSGVRPDQSHPRDKLAALLWKVEWRRRGRSLAGGNTL